MFSSLESPTIFDKRFKVTLVPFFIADFNLLVCELDKFTFKVLYWSFYIKAKIKLEYFTFTVPCEKSKTISLASSIMKNIVD